MAEINRVDLHIGHKSANPFKTTRKSETNPFEYKNFEGNTLQFADVFEGFNSKEVSFKGNKQKMISSSVMGSITKLRNSITEPIVNFVNRIRTGITNAWDYALHKDVTEIAGIKNIKEGLNAVKDALNTPVDLNIGRSISDSIAGLGNKISKKISFLNKDVTEIGHDLAEKWTAITGNVSSKTHATSAMPVAELRDMWIKENEILESQHLAKEISIKPEDSMKVRVA